MLCERTGALLCPLRPADGLRAGTGVLLRGLCLCLGTPGRQQQPELELGT